MKKYIISLFLVSNLTYASSAKLADFLISSSGIVEILAKYGVKGEDAAAVKSYVARSLSALTTKNGNISKEELNRIISGLPITGNDANIRKELQMLLDKSENEIKKEDVVKAINNIIYLANRHGKSVIITCADCVNENLARNGFRFTVDEIKNTKTLDLLTKVIPNKPEELNSYITTRMRRLGLGDYSKVLPSVVSPTDEKSLALFLTLAESGTKEQKALIEAIKKVSVTKDGKVNIIDSSNPHKLWRELSDDMSADTMKALTDTLNEVAELRKKEGISTEQAFYQILDKRVGKSPELKKDVEKIKARRCFFK